MMTHHEVLATIMREKLVAILRGVPMGRLEASSARSCAAACGFWSSRLTTAARRA